MKVASALLLILCVSSVFALYDHVYLEDFIKATPQRPLRFFYQTPTEAIQDLTINLEVIADFGYAYVSGVGGTQVAGPNYLDQPPQERSMTVTLFSPSGIVLDLGTFFNGVAGDVEYLDATVAQPIIFQTLQNSPAIVVNTANNGYFNVLNVISWRIPYSIINPITKEGGFTLEFSFSSAVNAYTDKYPNGASYSNYFYASTTTQRFELTLDLQQGGIIGDPHFLGWNGMKFDFQGEPNHIYNAISHRDLQMNFKLKQKEFLSIATVSDLVRLEHNTYIDSIGFQTPELEFAVHSGAKSDKESAGYVLINHKVYEISKTRATIFESDNLKIEWVQNTERRLHTSGPVAGIIAIHTSSFEFQVFIIETGRDLVNPQIWNSHPFRFLEVLANYKKQDTNVHGILGQTVKPLSHFAEKIEGFLAVEGENKDYEVSHLFGNDFKFNLFEHIKH